MNKQLVKKILSRNVHYNLTTLLQICCEPTITKKQQDPYEKLRTYLSKLFSYASIMELHDDHLVELAEVLQGLYVEQYELDTYCYSILQYLDKQIGKQTTQKQQWLIRMSTSQRQSHQKPIDLLDIRYQTQIHTDGYCAQRTNMYLLLQDCLLSIHKYAGKGKTNEKLQKPPKQ